LGRILKSVPLSKILALPALAMSEFNETKIHYTDFFMGRWDSPIWESPSISDLVQRNLPDF
jgi:hypothetical protein